MWELSAWEVRRTHHEEKTNLICFLTHGPLVDGTHPLLLILVVVVVGQPLLVVVLVFVLPGSRVGLWYIIVIRTR